jgi:hypothetical protein
MLRRVDTWAGLLCIAIGGAVLWEARRYTIGTLGAMGPGFYPAVLGVLLAVTGGLIGLAAREGEEEDPLHAMPTQPEWRGRICIVAAVVFFISTAEHLGMALATFGCVLIAALGDRSTTWRGAALLAFGIAAFGTLLFHTLLGVSLPLWPW